MVSMDKAREFFISTDEICESGDYSLVAKANDILSHFNILDNRNERP